MMASSVSLKPFVSSSHANFSSTPGNFPTGFGPKKQILTEHKLKLNFSMDREMDVNTSAPVDGVAECLGGKKIEEPSIATLLMNLSNESDPSCVLSTPHSEVAISKQKIGVAHVCGALLRVDNSIMSPVLSRPLEFGAGIVMHSASKFIARHSDVMACGIAVEGESEDQSEAQFLQASGAGFFWDQDGHIVTNYHVIRDASKVNLDCHVLVQLV